ncbi:hypothetical protein [Dactylococcopsis salina]|nr:hypothetical protein [Dactylococcopsis salina]
MEEEDRNAPSVIVEGQNDTSSPSSETKNLPSWLYRNQEEV